MGIEVNLDIDKMVRQQDMLNSKIASEQADRDEGITVNYGDYYKKTISKTHIVNKDGFMYLTRYINNTIVRVQFNEEVTLLAVMGYFEISDDVFTKCGVRVHKEIE